MGNAAVRRRMSAAEYLAWEREQPTKHEYHHGEVFAMAGGSPRHSSWRYRVLERGDTIALANGAQVSVDAIHDGAFELAAD